MAPLVVNSGSGTFLVLLVTFFRAVFPSVVVRPEMPCIMAGMDLRDRCSSLIKAGTDGYVAPRAVFPSVVCKPRMLGILAGMDQNNSYALFPGKAVFACDNAPRAVIFSLVGRPRVLGILDQEGSCPRRTSCWFFWEMAFMGFCIQRSAWFDSEYMHCVSLRDFSGRSSRFLT